MPIIVEPNAEAAEALAKAAGQGAHVVASIDDVHASLQTSPEEYAVVLGSDVEMSAAASLADTLRVSRPAVSVILVRIKVETSVLAEALRSGMREVVEAQDIESIAEAVKRARAMFRALSGPSASGGTVDGKLITIFSPKGGVGKTTLAVNLAIALTGKKEHSVCLVDLDLAFGDIAITLQLFPARTIADVVALEGGLDFASLEPLLTPHKQGFSTLVAPVQPDAKDSIPPSLVSRVLRLLKENFEFVIIDTSPAFDEFVLQAFDETDELVLVTTLDVPTLKNVKIAAETLDLLNFPKPKRHLVLNRADDKVGLTPDKVEATLDMRITQSIPTSPEVAHATNSGEPITAANPRHPVSQAIMALGRGLTGPGSAPAPAKPESKGSDRQQPAKRGLLRRSGR
jgi:pilus assembly protein CpaE